MPLNHSTKEDYSLSIMGWSKKKKVPRWLYHIACYRLMEMILCHFHQRTQ